MKTNYSFQKTITLITFVIFMTLVNGAIAQTVKPKYDKHLADSLGGGDYGMKKYVLVMLKTGKIKSLTKVKRDSLFAGHLENIGKLAEQNKLILGGPISNDKKYNGVFVLNAKTIDEAKSILKADPAISAKLLEPEFYEWFTSAALPMYLKYHYMISKE